MDMTCAFHLVWLFAQKNNLNEDEAMMYHSICNMIRKYSIIQTARFDRMLTEESNESTEDSERNS